MCEEHCSTLHVNVSVLVESENLFWDDDSVNSSIVWRSPASYRKVWKSIFPISREITTTVTQLVSEAWTEAWWEMPGSVVGDCDYIGYNWRQRRKETSHFQQFSVTVSSSVSPPPPCSSQTLSFQWDKWLWLHIMTTFFKAHTEYIYHTADLQKNQNSSFRSVR